MKNDKDKKDTGGGIKDALITIFSVVLYIVYSLVKNIIEAVKHPSPTSIIKALKDIFFIMGAVISLVIAITLWPLTLAIIATIFIYAFCQFGFDIFDW